MRERGVIGRGGFLGMWLLAGLPMSCAGSGSTTPPWALARVMLEASLSDAMEEDVALMEERVGKWWDEGDPNRAREPAAAETAEHETADDETAEL